MIDGARVQISRRSRQLRSLWREEGYHGITDRTRRALARWLAPTDLVIPVRIDDVMTADVRRPPRYAIPAVDSKKPLRMNWVMTPPSPGSGGHSTLFRIIGYLEARGYVNRIYFYDVYGGDHQYYESIVRSYYGFHGPVVPLKGRMLDAHAVIATAWPTAYPVFNASCAGKRFYFVQDFEPSFHPMGAASVLAENTYRMGFHAITAGAWLARKLKAEYGMETDHFEFGCDVSRYRRITDGNRSGVAFYARPDTARRGSELGLIALQIFAARRPNAEIHVYGGTMGSLPFPFFNHGRVSPVELNAIYNRCNAGLVLSLTNVSLVPHEMLAAGCIPVVNDGEHNRIVLRNAFARYVPPTPHALAAALETLVTIEDFNQLSRAAAASVQSTTWDDAGAMVDDALRRALQH